MADQVYKMPKRAMAIAAIPAVAVWLVLFAVLLLFLSFRSLWWHICFWAITAALALYLLVYLPLYRLTVELRITDDRITYKSGLFVSRRRYMKRDRVIYVTYLRTPLTPLLGISSIRLRAAGSAIFIPYLGKKDAEKIEAMLEKDGVRV